MGGSEFAAPVDGPTYLPPFRPVVDRRPPLRSGELETNGLRRGIGRAGSRSGPGHPSGAAESNPAPGVDEPPRGPGNRRPRPQAGASQPAGRGGAVNQAGPVAGWLRQKSRFARRGRSRPFPAGRPAPDAGPRRAACLFRRRPVPIETGGPATGRRVRPGRIRRPRRHRVRARSLPAAGSARQVRWFRRAGGRSRGRRCPGAHR